MTKEEKKLEKLLTERKKLVKKIQKMEDDNEDILSQAECIEHELFSLECDKDGLDMEISILKMKLKNKSK